MRNPIQQQSPNMPTDMINQFAQPSGQNAMQQFLNPTQFAQQQPQGMNAMQSFLSQGDPALQQMLSQSEPPMMPQGMSSAMPQGMPSMMPQGMPSMMPQGMPSMMPQGMSSAMSHMSPSMPMMGKIGGTSAGMQQAQTKAMGSMQDFLSMPASGMPSGMPQTAPIQANASLPPQEVSGQYALQQGLITPEQMQSMQQRGGERQYKLVKEGDVQRKFFF
jgi:hypothetical protein